MAESYSVRAILSAKDRGFSSTMKNALGTVGTLGSKVRSGIGFGILAGVGMAAFNSITNSCRSLITEINSATATWKTFASNMQILGKSSSEITGVKKELQSFAEQTIYSSSEMASTYAQLAAVGTKSTLDLVKGFGGLAASAENPKQAMKTLSTQATQMAARPTVAWMDFKLMLEQAPAGMAAVAKEMGMSAQELTAKIQAGEVATSDFFDAIEKVGTSDAFAKMARQYKTADEAMAGLTETLGNKLQPVWKVLSQVAIDSIESIIDKLSQLNADTFAVKLKRFLYYAGKYMAVLKEDMAEIGSAFGEAFSAIGDSLSELNGAFGSTESVEGFASAMDVVKSALVGVAGFLKSNADIIAVLIKNLPKLILAFIGLKVLSSLVGGLSTISGLFGGLKKTTNPATKGVTSLKDGLNSLQKSAGIALIIVSLALLAKALTPLASLGTTAIAPLMAFGVVVAGLGMVFATFGPQLQKSVVGIVAFSASMAIMALAMAPIASTGKEGAVAMAAFGIVIAGLVIIFSIFGPALNAAIPGMLALGAAAFLVGAGMKLASSFIEALPPVIEQLGDSVSQVAEAVSTGFAVMCDGAATVVDAISGGVANVLDSIAGVIDSIGTAAANAGTGFERVANGIKTISGLSIGDIAKSLGAVALGMGKMAKSGDGIVTAASGMRVLVPLIVAMAGPAATLSTALVTLAASIPGLASGFTAAATSGAVFSSGILSAVPVTTAFGMAILICVADMMAFGAGMAVAAAGIFIVTAALSAAKSQMTGITSSASSSTSAISSMQGAVKGATGSLSALAATAKSSLGAVSAAFNALASTAKTAGNAAGNDFTTGLKSGLSKAPAAATSAVSAVVSNLRAGRPAAYSAGAYISQGFAQGMLSCLGTIKAAATQMAAAADAAVRAKAKIHSPSRVTRKDGNYWGEGFLLGILDMASGIRKAAESVMVIPNAAIPDLATSYSGEMSADYSYSRSASYSIEVPLTVDGKEFAKATATYTQDEIEKQQNRNNRKRGIVNV